MSHRIALLEKRGANRHVGFLPFPGCRPVFRAPAIRGKSGMSIFRTIALLVTRGANRHFGVLPFPGFLPVFRAPSIQGQPGSLMFRIVAFLVNRDAHRHVGLLPLSGFHRVFLASAIQGQPGSAIRFSVLAAWAGSGSSLLGGYGLAFVSRSSPRPLRFVPALCGSCPPSAGAPRKQTWRKWVAVFC